jgi:hypothetical protein
MAVVISITLGQVFCSLTSRQTSRSLTGRQTFRRLTSTGIAPDHAKTGDLYALRHEI